MKSPSIIDMHVHLFPPEMFEAVWSFFESHGWGVHREHGRQVVRTLTDHGVKMAVVLSYSHKKGVAHPLNEFTESVGAAHEMSGPSPACTWRTMTRASASPTLLGHRTFMDSSFSPWFNYSTLTIRASMPCTFRAFTDSFRSSRTPALRPTPMSPWT